LSNKSYLIILILSNQNDDLERKLVTTLGVSDRTFRIEVLCAMPIHVIQVTPNLQPHTQCCPNGLSTVGPVSFGPIGSQYLTSGVRKILELSSLIIKILS
jgi:hypothetical protein